MRYGASPIILLALCAGCTSNERSPRPGAEWGPVPNAYARHFEVQIRGSDRRVLVFGPGGKQDTAGVYVLHGGTAGTEIPVDTPLSRVAVVSTTHLPFFTALGTIDAVAGVAHGERLRDPELIERLRAGKIQEITRADGLDRERLLALAPQVLFDYPFGHKPGQPGIVPVTIAVTEYLEEHPLGRAEWVRFFGILLGRERKADSLFNAIAHRYTTLRDMRSALGRTPRVFFASSWEKDWFAPPGNSYMATLIGDAGGRYWFEDTSATVNIPVALEELISLADSCDHFGVVIEEPGRVDPLRLAGGDPRVAALRAVRKGGFLGNSASSDLFGHALLEPEVVLRDLRCIFHPVVCDGYRPTYFFPIAQ